MTRLLYAALGESDCEELGSGFLAQPVNAVSSLAFSVFGLAIIAWARSAPGLERTIRTWFGWLMVATGVGSFLFHGPQWPGAHFLHDITFLAAVVFVLTFNVVAAKGWNPRLGWIGFFATTVGAAVVLLIAPSSTNALTVIAVAGLVASEVVVHRVGGVDGRWYATALVLLVLALAGNAAGRTGSALCDPESVFQAHGAWHVLAAGFLTAYFVATAGVRAHAMAR